MSHLAAGKASSLTPLPSWQEKAGVPSPRDGHCCSQPGSTCPLSLLPGTALSPDLDPCTFGKARHSPLPRRKTHRDWGGGGVLHRHRFVLGRLCLLTASGIKVDSHFYKVISNLVFLLGGLLWLEQKRSHWLEQSSEGECNLICAFPSLLLISRLTAGI